MSASGKRRGSICLLDARQFPRFVGAMYSTCQMLQAPPQLHNSPDARLPALLHLFCHLGAFDMNCVATRTQIPGFVSSSMCAAFFGTFQATSVDNPCCGTNKLVACVDIANWLDIAQHMPQNKAVYCTSRPPICNRICAVGGFISSNTHSTLGGGGPNPLH